MEYGSVIHVSQNRAMVVIKHSDGFALVELIGDEGAFSIGDIVRGNWDELGGETVAKAGETFDCYFQGSWGTPDIPIGMFP